MTKILAVVLSVAREPYIIKIDKAEIYATGHVVYDALKGLSHFRDAKADETKFEQAKERLVEKALSNKDE